jgi:hypothetical protein
MNKKLSCFLICASFGLHAEDQIPSTESSPEPQAIVKKIETKKVFNSRESHWVTSFGFETMKYEVPIDFTGVKAKFKDQKREIFGGRIGVGREFHLGGGFLTTSRIEGFYMGTLFEKAQNAGPEQASETISYTKKTGHVYGADLTQSFSYVFDFKIKNPFIDERISMSLESFVFAGLGRGKVYNRLSYHYETNILEDYRIRVEDKINTTSLGAGFNLISSEGFFFYLKATQYQLGITDRSEKGLSQPSGQPLVRLNRTTKSVSSDPTYVYAIGGGYKF